MKVINTIMAAVLSVSLFGCTAQKTEDMSTSSDKTADIKEEVGGGEAGDTVSVTLPNTFKVPSKDVYIDAPNYQEIEEGFTRVFIVHGEKYCTVTSELMETATTLTEAHNLAFSSFKTNMMNYEGGVNSIQINKEEYLTINGIDTYYFEGLINYGIQPVFDGYAVGYAFIIDGVPCEIIGSVIDGEQSSATIQEIKDNVDAMMKSVRTTE